MNALETLLNTMPDWYPAVFWLMASVATLWVGWLSLHLFYQLIIRMIDNIGGYKVLVSDVDDLKEQVKGNEKFLDKVSRFLDEVYKNQQEAIPLLAMLLKNNGTKDKDKGKALGDLVSKTSLVIDQAVDARKVFDKRPPVRENKKSLPATFMKMPMKELPWMKNLRETISTYIKRAP